MHYERGLASKVYSHIHEPTLLVFSLSDHAISNIMLHRAFDQAISNIMLSLRISALLVLLVLGNTVSK